MPIDPEVLRAVESLLGVKGVLSKPNDRKLYEYDGGVDKSIPDIVAFPRTTEDVVGLVKIANKFGISIVGRGAGTGLSGGAIAVAGGMMISVARMNRILEIDIENEFALGHPGVVTLDLALPVAPFGYFYSPDPSSQRACTIGGNVAENAPDPHTLAYGVP